MLLFLLYFWLNKSRIVDHKRLYMKNNLHEASKLVNQSQGEIERLVLSFISFIQVWFPQFIYEKLYLVMLQKKVAEFLLVVNFSPVL